MFNDFTLIAVGLVALVVLLGGGTWFLNALRGRKHTSSS
jgi:hypothetical protein